jgi:hypothetical protein
MRPSRFVLPAAVALFGLACTPASHPPLVCDEAAAGEVAFLFHDSVGFLPGYFPHGWGLLAVDGSCRYVVLEGPDGSGAPRGELRSGVLTDAELRALNEELLTRDWVSVDGARAEEPITDAGTTTFRRRDTGAGAGADRPRVQPAEAECYASCDSHDALRGLDVLSRAWVTRLWARGEPLAGPLDLHFSRGDIPSPATAVPWTGAADLSALRAEGSGRARITDPADVRLLRSLRAEAALASYWPPLALEQDGRRFEVTVADVPPFDLALPNVRLPDW